MTSMWLCPNGHEIDQYSQLESWKKKPYLTRSALKRGLFNNCHNVCQKGCGFSYGCSLILNRNWTIDELMLTICNNCNAGYKEGNSICWNCERRWQFSPKSSWQPKYLGNTTVK